MSKPTVQIREWMIFRAHRQSDRQWALTGKVLDHPRFEYLTRVTSSSILKPEDSELGKLKDGDIVETRNTLYKLIGNNQNGESISPPDTIRGRDE